MSLFLIIIYCNLLTNHLVSLNCLQPNIFDYIIVGSGSSGAIVATRLTENGNITVLLLEAGKEPLPESYIPLTSVKVLSGEMNWNYTLVSQENRGELFKDNELQLYRGKALGGSSSINGMIYTRGNKRDYDLWHKLGNRGWNYSSIYQYFLKIEDYNVPRSRYDDEYHNEGGPISVELASFQTPLADAFLRAGMEIGQPLVDYNAEFQTGFMISPANMKDGARCSTYNCYLQPVMDRSNLHVLTSAFVTKIIINKKMTATGVEYEKDSLNCTAKARKEVIISAGAINTPQLLMLSGIGPKESLEQFQIPLVKDLPGVGQNLQDQALLTQIVYSINQTISFNSLLSKGEEFIDLWEQSRTGPLTCPFGVEAIAYYQSNSNVTKVTDYPDIEIQFSPSNVIELFTSNGTDEQVEDQITFFIFLLRPKSRGEVTLQSNDPHDAPLIDPKYLSHSEDIDGLVTGLNFVRQLVDTKAFQQYGTTLVGNEIMDLCNSSSSNDSEEYDKCLVRGFLSSSQHVSSTCKMGPIRDKMAVVDSRLRVHGIKKLRIVDGSIMPNLISAHPNIACMMIGEKGSDMIKEDNND